MITRKNYLALVVDDEKLALKLMSTLLESAEVDFVLASSCKTAVNLIDSDHRFDIVITDYLLPDGSGEDIVKLVHKKNPSTPILVFSGIATDIKISAYTAGANFVIQKPFSGSEFIMVVKNLISLGEAKEDLEDAENIIKALCATLEARDSYTEGHGQRVAKMSIALYDVLETNNRKQRHDLYIGALLHDIGKIGVPDHILKSPWKLSESDYKLVKTHVNIGYEICRGLDGISGSLDVIKQHHERLDGSGYPDGIKGKEISMLAQIVAIADTYDAMTSMRSYREELTKRKALEEINKDVKSGKINKKFFEAFRDKVLLDEP